MSEDSNKELESEDQTISNLLQLDGDKFVIDERSGLWVKFEAKEVPKSADRPHGVKYSLTLHDRSNKRIMGFDNAHAIEFGAKKRLLPKKLIITGIEMKMILEDHMNIRMQVSC